MTSLHDAWSQRPAAARHEPFRLTLADGLALLCLVVAGALYCLNLTGPLLTDDEESYLYAAWRVSVGEIPYRDFLTPQLPGFLYPGGLVMRLFGPTVFPPRFMSVLVTLVAAWFVYLIGRRLVHPKVGLAALVLYLSYPRVVDMARLYRPEAYMLVAQVAALYLFVVAEQKGNRRWLVASGVMFGVAILCKLFGALPLVGIMGYLAWRGLFGRPWRDVILDAVAVGGSALAVVVVVMGSFWLITPDTYMAVLGHHLAQGSGLSHVEVFEKGAAFLVDYWWEYTAVLVLAFAGVWLTIRCPGLSGFLAWQLPTALVFLFMSRELYLRHTVYLAPAVCLLAAMLLEPLLNSNPGSAPRWGRFIAVAVVISVFAPWLQDSWNDNSHVDDETWRVVAYLNETIPPGVPFLTDNSGLNFYSLRPTTPTAASLSKGATESGQITAAKLLAEMDAMHIDWVLYQEKGGGQTLDRLHDKRALDALLDQHFEPIKTLERERATYILLHRKDG